MARRIGTRDESRNTGASSDSSNSGRLMVQALMKGLAVISVFDLSHAEWTVDEIAKEIDLPKMTVYRLVRTMEDLGFLVGDPASNRYHLGPATLPAVHVSWRRAAEIAKVARPYLEELASETKESVSLAVEIDRVAVQIDSVQGSRPFRPLIAPGRVADWSAHAKLFVVMRPEEERRHEPPPYAHPWRVARDIESPELALEAEKILAEGVAYDLEERELGTCAVAAPILDQSGDVVASLAVVAPPGRFQPPEREILCAALKRVASSLSRYFGYFPSPDTKR